MNQPWQHAEVFLSIVCNSCVVSYHVMYSVYEVWCFQTLFIFLSNLSTCDQLHPDSSECVRLDVFAVVPTEVSEVDVCVCVRVVLLFLFNVLLCITFMCENEWMCVGLSDSDAC